jgi:DNA primase
MLQKHPISVLTGFDLKDGSTMPRIPEPQIERLKAEVSLVRLIEGAGHVLVRQGKDLALRCPLHAGDDTPSCVVTPAKNVWHCFGCGRGGSVIDWVMLTRKVSFRHAVELLQQDSAALVAPSTTAVRSASSVVLPGADDAALLAEVVGWYHTALLSDADGQAYLRARGLTHPDLVATFRLGVASRTLGYRLPEKDRVQGAAVRGALQRIGLLRSSGHEHFAGSLVVPVFDGSGGVAEVYGRKIGRGLRPGTPLHLYLPGPHRGVFNAAGITGCESVILCEAFIDAMTFWCAGLTHVTSSFGAGGFTDALLQALIANGTRRVWIAYDRDEAGDLAAEKLAPLLQQHGIAAYRVWFPKGMDANEYALKVGPAEQSLGMVLRSAEPMLDAAALPVSFAVSSSMVKSSVAAPSVASVSCDLPAPAPAASSLVAAVASSPSLAAASPAHTHVPAPAPTAPVDVSEREVVVTFGDRRYRVRGLEKNLAYDVLKVNVLVTSGEGLHVDTLDLYQAKARASFAKQSSVELCIEESALQRDLGQLLLQLETLQEARIAEATRPKAPAAAVLSAEEEVAGLALLRDPQLVQRIVADVAAIGVVGEDSNALVGYLACVSRKLDKPLAVLIQSTSAAGKSTLMDGLLSLMPVAERVQYSAMTGQSLFYLGEGDLRHKILAIAEEEGVRQAAYALKLLQSQGELTIASTGKDPATGKLVTEEYRVEGPVMLCLTTTAIDLDEELLNRCVVLTINESREQTAAIHARQRQARTLSGLLDTQQGETVRRVHRAAQALLRPVAVVNPFAEALTFRSESTRMRRDHAKYLTLIDAIAFLHQQQRPIKTATLGDAAIEYVEVTLDDIALANRLASEVLGRSLDELPPQTRRVLAAVVGLVASRMQAQALVREAVRFTRRELREAIGMTDTALCVHLDRLVSLEYVLIHRGGNGQRFVYELLFDGDASVDAPQLIGLLDVATLRSAGTTRDLTPPAVALAPTFHPAHTPLPPTLQGEESAKNRSKSASASTLVAAVDEIAPHGANVPARRRSRSPHANAAVAS